MNIAQLQFQFAYKVIQTASLQVLYISGITAVTAAGGMG